MSTGTVQGGAAIGTEGVAAGAVGGFGSTPAAGTLGGSSTGAIPKRTNGRIWDDQPPAPPPASGRSGMPTVQEQAGLGLPINPAIFLQGRGRGRPPQDLRNPQPPAPNLGRDITAPPRQMQDDAEYYDLRDQLLCHLLRRDRQQAEGARIPKAIHNWPFKFRGAKESTSLNTFLDRVEYFANSEGVSRAMLLRSVKHLLQDDALDWYGRAFNEGELDTWENFKLRIRQEYLPCNYSQLLRMEAMCRFQGLNESFQKYYRDISALFRFVEPPMTEEEKFFILKKNMHSDYANVLASSRPQTIQEMVEICNGYDDTRTLLNHQRRTTLPYNSLLEPSFATPSNQQRSQGNSSGWQKFGRVNAVDSREENQDNRWRSGGANAEQQENQDQDEEWTQQIDQLTQQICAIRSQFQKRNNEQLRRSGNFSGQRWHASQQQEQASENQQPLAAGNRQQQDAAQLRVYQRQPEQVPGNADQQHRQGASLCWNCDEEGHRYQDCDKAQAVFFCYRCGRKGYTLRNCPECAVEQGNGQARNQ